jgi:hypothetical protein
MRTIAFVLILLLCTRMGAPCRRPDLRPDSAPPGPRAKKVCPVSLRYRQQIHQQIHLPPVQPDGQWPSASQPFATHSLQVAQADARLSAVADDSFAPLRC